MPCLRNTSMDYISYPTIPINQKESFLLRFLYHTIPGRCLLWLLIRPLISKGIGAILNTKLSKIIIEPFIKKNRISMSRFQKENYKSFNAFFCRKLKKSKTSIPKNTFISPCDGKLSVYKITEDLRCQIKHSIYSVESLIEDKNLAEIYKNGYCLVFRLTPDDYHRYHFIDDGKIIQRKKINGVLHTVRPIALDKYPVFSKNAREVTVMETKQFKTITQIEVGALFVGKIQNENKENFKQNEEKGKFLFGGSTIVLLIQKDAVDILDSLQKNTEDNLETLIHFQDIIGMKIK